MPTVGSFVKPKRPGTWRLGVVEEVREDGRYNVRMYVAPEGAYSGSAAVYRRDEVVEVPRAKVAGYLDVVRAIIAQRQTEARQIEEALGAGS